MKTPEELNSIKAEFEALSAKLAELSDDELKEVFGGYDLSQDDNSKNSIFKGFLTPEDKKQYEIHLYK